MMAVWYMVKRLDTGEINGIDTWFYGIASSATAKTGEVEAHRHKDGRPHHLITHVDARDGQDARFTAECVFDEWMKNSERESHP